jgi:hypothetical protein
LDFNIKTREGIPVTRTTSLSFLKLPAVAATAALIMISLASSAQTPNAFVGKWVLNISKSTFNPPPPLKSHTVTVTQVAGGGIHTTLDIGEADGTSLHVEYTTALDGKAVPVTGYPNADSIIVTQVSPRTIKNDFLKAGKTVETGTFIVSKSGKTMHGSLSGTEGGVPWKYHYIFERQ